MDITKLTYQELVDLGENIKKRKYELRERDVYKINKSYVGRYFKEKNFDYYYYVEDINEQGELFANKLWAYCEEGRFEKLYEFVPENLNLIEITKEDFYNTRDYLIETLSSI